MHWKSKWQPTPVLLPGELQGWERDGREVQEGGDICIPELLIAKFRLKLKKVGKTTRLFRYDLNQIPYDYTVEVRNRFKGLDLIDRVPDEMDGGS